MRVNQMMKKLMIGVMFMGFSASTYAQKASPAKDISVAKLERKISKDIQLVDVRTPKEYKEGHIGNAVNINVNSPQFISDIQKLDKKKKVYVYCKSGKRSAMAVKKMDSLGFKRIYNLPVGYVGWDKEKKN